MPLKEKEAKKRLVELMRKYNLTKQEVMFASLIASHISYGEAFECVFRSSANNKELAAKRYITGRPQIDVLAEALETGMADKKVEDEIKTKLDGVDLRTKDGVLTALETELKNVTDPKQRTEIIGKIADLQRMKNEEDKQSRELIHYYLPLRCEECPYKTKIDELNNANENIL